MKQAWRSHLSKLGDPRVTASDDTFETGHNLGRNAAEVHGSEEADGLCGIGDVRLRALVLTVAKAEQVLCTIDKYLIPALARIINILAHRYLHVH
jgi:hypothetical protein